MEKFSITPDFRFDISKLHRHDEIPDRSEVCTHESGGIENPGTPRYKKDKMPITYMQNGIQHENGSFHVRLSLPKKLKEYMAHTYNIRAAYLYLGSIMNVGVC